MPPRYAYWTILIDGKATAFRARDREELLPTFNQLARKNTSIVMRYFARGRLWDNPEQAQFANRTRDSRPVERRDREWRPGGQHKDPRARSTPSFDAPQTDRERPPRGPKAPWRNRAEARPRGGAGKAGWSGKGGGAGKTERPFGQRPRSSDRKPFNPDQKSFNQKEGNARFEGRPKDRRAPKFGAPAGKRPGRWNRPPKRDKPR